MFLCLRNVTFLLAMRWDMFREDRFLGKVLDEWTADSQEFAGWRDTHRCQFDPGHAIVQAPRAAERPHSTK